MSGKDKGVEAIHIALAADGRYQNGLVATRASIAAACSAPERLEFHEFGADAALAERIRRDFGTYKCSPMAFLRLYLAELLPDCDWVVYSDVDVLWFADVCELWNLRDDECEVMWVRDIPSTRREAAAWQRRINPAFDSMKYGCSGVMLLNLKKMRESRLLERAVAFTAREGLFPYVDQDILNSLCHGTSALLPPKWDVIRDCPRIEFRRGRPDCVMHIIGIGQRFDGRDRGRLPQFDLWYRFAAAAGVLSPGPAPASAGLRFAWALAALLQPVMSLLPLPDCILRAAFFARLRRCMLKEGVRWI